MKRLFIIFTVFAGLAFMAACEKDDEKVTLDLSEGVAAEVDALDPIVLIEENAPDTIVLSWTPADYGAVDLSSVTYRVHLLHADTVNVTLGATTDTSFGITVNTLNSRLRNLGFEPGVETDFQFRVSSFVAVETNGTMLHSDPVTVSLTPYEAAEPVAAVLYVPGAYQGWNPGAAPNVYSPTDDGVYSGYVHFPADVTDLAFKFAAQPNWEGPNYGFAAEGTLDTDPGAGNLSVDSVGTYYMTVDTEGLTWSHEVRNYALIGTFNNWEADEPITWDSEAQVFTATIDFVEGDKFKWRANGDWVFNLGVNNPDDGKLVQGGADIEVPEAGNYTVILDLYNQVPTYELIKN